jgi:hypothetical protein
MTIEKETMCEKEKEWYCEICKYSSKRRADFKRHLLSSKHIQRSAPTPLPRKKLSCVCGKHYVHMSGLCRHKANCPFVAKETQAVDEPELSVKILDEVASIERKIDCLAESENKGDDVMMSNETDQDDTSKMLVDILQQVKDLKELVPTGNASSVTTNNNNYFVNLNVFLNNTCKDALSVDDFVKQIEFVFDDLQDEQWRSKVLLSNLISLQVEERPFHCVDPATCEVMMNTGGKWESGGKEHLALTLNNCGKQVQAKFGNKWEDSFPGWTRSEAQNRRYMSLWKNITSEPSQDALEEEVKHVSTETVLHSSDFQIKDV